MAMLPPVQPVPPVNAPFVPPTFGGSDPWKLSQGLKGIERGAAARGTLLTGGTQKALMDYGIHSAEQDYGNDYQRALQTYTTNRDTNTLSYGQARTGYQDMLDAQPGIDRQQIENDRLRAQQRQSQTDMVSADAQRNREELEQNRALSQQALANAQAQPRSWSEPHAPQQPFVLSQPSIDPLAEARAQQGPQNQQLQQQYAAMVAEQERKQREQDARIREETARKNAAMPPPMKPVPYLPYVGVGRGA